jgi:hypothetical protein
MPLATRKPTLPKVRWARVPITSIATKRSRTYVVRLATPA